MSQGQPRREHTPKQIRPCSQGQAAARRGGEQGSAAPRRAASPCSPWPLPLVFSATLSCVPWGTCPSAFYPSLPLCPLCPSCDRAEARVQTPLWGPPHMCLRATAQSCSLWVDPSVTSPASTEGSLACLPPWSGPVHLQNGTASPATLWACCRAGQLVQEKMRDPGGRTHRPPSLISCLLNASCVHWVLSAAEQRRPLPSGSFQASGGERP